MEIIILLAAAVLILCVFSDRLSGKIGVPALLIFIAVGIFFGVDGVVKIPFENYEFAARVCETALILIMFNGGFSMNWQSAKPVIIKAGLLSTLGVVITAGATCAFCALILKMPFAESLLVGSVIASTDAASVFSVLRSKKLNLKNGLAPLLEAESGSNDPFSYMLTMISLSLLQTGDTSFIFGLVLKQLLFGALFGAVVGVIGAVVVKMFRPQTEGFECILFPAFALLAYALPTLFDGNGYLAVYIAGIILGNAKIPAASLENGGILRKFIVNVIGIILDGDSKNIAPPTAVVFLNGITGICQILVFFLLGLIAAPSSFVNSLIPAAAVYLCLTLVSRPLAMILLGGKSPIKDRLFLSFAGLRGASSIVFAIVALVSPAAIQCDIFNIVFIVCLMSMIIQGTLLPKAARALNLIDNESNVLKTFNDYKEDASITMMRMFVPEDHSWAGKKISEITMPTGSLAVMIKRGEKTIVPRGDTIVKPCDNVILSVPPVETDKSLKLREISITDTHRWADRKIRDLSLPENLLIVMVKRRDECLIPTGATEILPGDTVVITNTYKSERSVISQI